MVEKAGAFEVALPGAAADGSGGDGDTSSTSSSSATTKKKRKEEDDLAGVGLAFYSQIYVLKVPIAHFLHLRAIL